MKRQTIYVLGYPKSGTTWLSRLLGDALNSPVGAIRPRGDGKAIATEGQDRPGPYYIRQGHAVPGPGETLTPGRHVMALEHLTDEKVVILLRDPRDIAVSAAHHWGRSIEETLHCMGKGLWPIPHGGGWVKWVKKWQPLVRDKKPPFIKLTYEYLWRNEHRALYLITRGLVGKKVDRDTILQVITRQSFTARVAYTHQHGDSLNYGKDFQLRFLRKGIVGDWQNHFTPLHRRLAEEYFGEMMRELGYTESDKWVNE